ncbi:putative Dixin [Hypsibius exemplaris]|uniref:Dixin n=1 Tax=Hypsibius exemplaris TaxID=2072580 RepID=A0A1W0X8R2_HYPEX|nr:putative Dixin [Hypsibius exemplaris]
MSGVSSTPPVNGTSINGTEWSHYQAYLTWINCQLKKNPQAIRPIQDIRTELQDGTLVASLIEILGNHRLSGVDWQPAPQSLPVRISNYNAILRYLTLQRVALHPTINVADLARGELKPLLRLIHALAGHFKPESITPQQQLSIKYSKNNVYGLSTTPITTTPNRSGQVASSLVSSISYREDDSSLVKTPSKTGSLTLPSPLRKSKSYSSLRNGADRDNGRRVTFTDTMPTYGDSLDTDPEEENEPRHGSKGDFGCEDSSEVKVVKEKLQEMIKRTTTSLLVPSNTQDDIKSLLDTQQIALLALMDEMAASNQALHADISTYKDRCSILETTKSGLIQKIKQVEQELYRVREDLQKMQVMNLNNCNSSTSSNASSSPSLEQTEFQKKMDFKNRQLADLRKELDSKDLIIAQLHSNKNHSCPPLPSSLYEPQRQRTFGGDEEGFQPAHAKPLSASAYGGEACSSLFVTKVLYQIEGSTTPIRCSITKHFREITLFDIRKVIDRPPVYRYYFETIDPDVGRVKEEITKDNALVPDVDGRIMVSLELTSLDTHV